MKKFFSLLLTLSIAFVGFSAVLAAPAQAGEAKSIQICHSAGKSGNYTVNVVDKSSIITSGHGDHEYDIIPAFTWNDGGNKKGSFPGLNWDSVGEATYLNGCVTPAPAKISVIPVAPVLVPATCIDPTGNVSIPAQPEGVTVLVKKLVGTPESPVWSVTFGVSDGDKYEFATGSVNMFSVPVNIVGPEDSLWNSEMGACNLSDTGLSAPQTAILLAGGAAVLLLGAGASFLGRRRTA